MGVGRRMDRMREKESDRGRKTERLDGGQPSLVYALLNKSSAQVLTGISVCVCGCVSVCVCSAGQFAICYSTL